MPRTVTDFFSKVVPKFVSIVASVVLLVTVDLIPKLKLPCTCSRNFTRSLAVTTILSLYISASPKSLNKIFLGEPSFSVMPSSPAGIGKVNVSPGLI
ncbi:hypothetical protein WZ342_2580 [Enterococcus faecalis]|nr:hypothetical protein WZ342_2580 [Enterococcus faecalis]